MRKLIAIILLMNVMAAGCGKSNSNDNNDGVIATTPIANCMYYGYGYNGGCNFNYNQYQGFQNYPYDSRGYYQGYNNNYATGFCNCPSGTRPVYNGSWGLGCVATTYMNSTSYPYQYSNWDTRRWAFQTVSDGYYNVNAYGSYNSTYQQANNGCYSNVASVCQVGLAGSCGTGYCQPVGGGSTLGMCVNNYR